MEIDLVYTWVNGNDPEWRKKRESIVGTGNDQYDQNCEGRYADSGELKYSLRAIERYAPWIRKIYIITDGQIPVWLNTENPKIRIIDHKEILPPESLPTFNSVVIEHYLYKIPGLAEHFLYANDDMFVNRPVSPEDFFTPDGRPIARLNRRPLRKLTLFLERNILGKKITNYNLTIQTAAELVKRKYGKYFSSKTHHNIDAYNKSEYQHIFEVFSKEILPTVANHIRSENDIQRNLYTYVALAEKKALPKYVTQKTSFRLHTHKPHHYQRLQDYNPKFFCVNDSQFATDEDRQRLASFLENKFRIKSKFEK